MRYHRNIIYCLLYTVIVFISAIIVILWIYIYIYSNCSHKRYHCHIMDCFLFTVIVVIPRIQLEHCSGNINQL